MSARPLVRRELRDAVRRYWFLVNAGSFAVAGLLFILFGQSDALVLGDRGFARALAGLMQLAVVFVPLMALIPAVAAIAGERENGTLDFMLAQPVTRGEVYAAKWVGVLVAVVLSVVAGLSVTASAAALRGVPSGPVAAVVGGTALLAATFVSLGIWISARSSSRTRSTSFGITLWLALVGLGSLGVMSAFVRWGAPPWALQAWTLTNPVEAYRAATLAVLDPDVEILGPVGASLLDALGRGGLVALALTSLSIWTGVGFFAGRRSFSRADRGGGGAARERGRSK